MPRKKITEPESMDQTTGMEMADTPFPPWATASSARRTRSAAGP